MLTRLPPTAFSPYLDRAAIRAPADIVARMAEDMRARMGTSDCCTEDDLETYGWSRKQITSHGREAARRAASLAARERAARRAA